MKDSEVDRMIQDKHDLKGFLSHAYKKLMSQAQNKALIVKAKWEEDIDTAFTDTEWEEICSSSQSFPYNSRHKLLQFNIIHRVY